MATTAFKNAKIYVAGYDLSGKLNACAVEYGSEMLDNTHFGDDTRINKAGLSTVRVSHQGHWDSNGTDGVDDVLQPRLGTGDIPSTVCGQTGIVGDYAYTFRAVESEYQLGGQIGELLPFSVTLEGGDGIPPVRGKIIQAAGSVTATGTGTAVEIGATASGQKVYAVLHVLSASGTTPTLDVVVQSDVDGSFASPITVATFSQKTAAGSDWQSADGPVTDTYFRVSYTLGGTSPDFSFVVVVGIA